MSDINQDKILSRKYVQEINQEEKANEMNYSHLVMNRMSIPITVCFIV